MGTGSPGCSVPLPPTPTPGSSPAVFVDFYACGETARCQVAGPGVWASLAAPGLAQTPPSAGLRWGAVTTNLAVHMRRSWESEGAQERHGSGSNLSGHWAKMRLKGLWLPVLGRWEGPGWDEGDRGQLDG